MNQKKDKVQHLTTDAVLDVHSGSSLGDSWRSLTVNSWLAALALSLD
jgi:hypothetical protein